MTTSVTCKTSYMTSPSGQCVSEPVNVSHKGCDQAQAVSSDFNLIEMTEVEYTHLQHLFQSHMEVQNDAEEVRLNPPPSPDHESENTCNVYPPLYKSPECQPDASSSLPFVPVPNNQGSKERQEVYSDPSNIGSLGECTPTSNGEVPDCVLAKMRCVMEAVRDRNDHRKVHRLGSRPSPPARVCLEKRFNCDSCNLTKKQESQAAVLNRFLSMLQNSTDMPGIIMHSQLEKWPKEVHSTPVDCSHPHTGNQLLDNKRSERIVSKNLSVNKSADSLLRSPCIIYASATNEEQVISTENELEQKDMKRAMRRGSRVLQAHDPNIMPSSGKRKPVSIMPVHKAGRRPRRPLEISQRRERHNLKERDRRRRIRLCCDELNMLVPFCYAETDKATTLQWTTAYLKYIREIYGDSLKQAFQNSFCGKTGVRIRPSCTNDVNSTSNE